MIKMSIEEQLNKFESDKQHEIQLIREHILFCNANNVSVKIMAVVVNMSDIMGDVKLADITLSIGDMLQAEEINDFINCQNAQTGQPDISMPPLPPNIPPKPKPILNENESTIKRLLNKLSGAKR